MTSFSNETIRLILRNARDLKATVYHDTVKPLKKGQRASEYTGTLRHRYIHIKWYNTDEVARDNIYYQLLAVFPKESIRRYSAQVLSGPRDDIPAITVRKS